MKRILTAMLFFAVVTADAQQVNDSNTPLHLLKPNYTHKYGIPTTKEVKQTIDRVLK